MSLTKTFFFNKTKLIELFPEQKGLIWTREQISWGCLALKARLNLLWCNREVQRCQKFVRNLKSALKLDFSLYFFVKICPLNEFVSKKAKKGGFIIINYKEKVLFSQHLQFRTFFLGLPHPLTPKGAPNLEGRQVGGGELLQFNLLFLFLLWQSQILIKMKLRPSFLLNKVQNSHQNDYLQNWLKFKISS